MDIKQVDSYRFKYLEEVYLLTNGNISDIYPIDQVEQELGLDKAAASQIYSYLINEGLIEIDFAGQGTCLSHKGRKEVEEAYRNPDRATEHFSANVVNFYGPVSNSPIQQGNTNSTQTTTFNIAPAQKVDISAFIADIKANLERLQLQLDLQTELMSEIVAIQSQLDSPNPKAGILKIALESIESILLGVSIDIAVPVAKTLLVSAGSLLQQLQ